MVEGGKEKKGKEEEMGRWNKKKVLFLIVIFFLMLK